jgi:thiol-disulfide isomerase/thioredoxin
MNLGKLFFIIIITTLCSCSSPIDEIPLVDPYTGLTSIDISSDKAVLEVGETVSFTVIDNEGEDVTSQSAILIDGNSISGSTFVPEQAGAYEATSTYESLVSSKIYVTATEPVTITSVEIRTYSDAIFIGNSATFTATAVYSNGSTQDKTSESEFYIDDVLLAGNEYTSSQEGTVIAKAVFDAMSSSDISLAIVDPSNLPASFSKKAVVEDYTGTWCGWCPRVSHAASLVEEQTDKVFVVGVHNGDQMANSFGDAMENEFDIPGFPTAYVDRANTWAGDQPNNLDQVLNVAEGSVAFGLAIESSLTGSILDFKIYQGFLQNMSDVKLVVFVLEDGILANQANYTSYYGGGSTITDFEHNGVLRYSATNVMGDSTTSTAGIHDKSFSVDLSAYGVLVPENTGILAMLVDQSGRVLLNAQYVAANESRPFD